MSAGPDLLDDVHVYGLGHRRRAARRLRRGWLDDRRADDADLGRLPGDCPGERPAGHPLQVQRRRDLDRRSGEHAAVARRLRRVQLGHPRRLQPLPGSRADGLARRDDVLHRDRSILRRRCHERHAGRRRRLSRPVSGRRLQGHPERDRGRLLHRSRHQHDLDHLAAREHVARRARQRRPHVLRLSRLLAERRDRDRRALRHAGRSAGDDRQRARARHPDLARLRDEPRDDRRAAVPPEQRLVLARQQRDGRQLRVR